MPQTVNTFALALALLACASCANEPNEPNDQAEQNLYVASTLVWPRDPSSLRYPISLCWATPGFETEKQWVREAIRVTWGQVTKIALDWHECVGSEPNSVHVVLRDSSAGVYTHSSGIANRGVPEGLVLNPWEPWCRTSRQGCIYSTAVHEFGHILGFDHENQRPDATCRESDQSDRDDYSCSAECPAPTSSDKFVDPIFDPGPPAYY